jgi:hypothetical protein
LAIHQFAQGLDGFTGRGLRAGNRALHGGPAKELASANLTGL